MPWYKSGTVSVTQNSNAVLGTGTAFIANSRVGDAFRGPDGAWYEVTNIASDAAMSISPNYQGATNASGGYALAPLQGYVKDSADALRSLVNLYGAKLAALGTTGNYDILPVAKGGTGGADQASARSGLGLGSFGSTGIAWSADLNAITSSQFFGWGSGSTSNIPIADFGEGIHIPATDPNAGSQIAFCHNSTRAFYRRKTGGTWQAWVELLTSDSNTYGSNANGSFIKFADGTMICTRAYGALAVAAGATQNVSSLSFAAAFTSGPVVTIGVSSSYPYDVSVGAEPGISTSACRPSIKNRNASIAISDIYLLITAIGRWK